MVTMIFSQDAGSEMGRHGDCHCRWPSYGNPDDPVYCAGDGYDLFYRKPPVNIDVGDDGMDDLPDDAAEFAAEFAARREAEGQREPKNGNAG